MSAQLGINCAGRAEQQPADIAATGAKWVRVVAYPDADISTWIDSCHGWGLKVLLVLARESIGDDQLQRIALFVRRYSHLVDAVQVGNESDHVSGSSWTMTQEALTKLLYLVRAAFGPDKLLIGPGLVSGQPQWAASVDWRPVSALSVHPYAKEPGTLELDRLLAGYAAYGKPIWVTEYNSRTIGMAAALRDDRRLSMAMAFCYSDSMVPGFGLIEDKAALADFKAAAGWTPMPDQFSVGDGMRALMAQRADSPASDEIYFTNRAGRDQFSEAAGVSGRLYRYIRSTGQTYSYAPEP